MDERQEPLDVDVTLLSEIVLSSLFEFYKVLQWPLMKYKVTNKKEISIKVFITREITGLPYEMKLPETFILEPYAFREFDWYPPSVLNDDKIVASRNELQFSIYIKYNFNGVEKNAFEQGYLIKLLPRNVIYWAVPSPEKGEYFSLLDYLVEWVVPPDSYVRRKLNRALKNHPGLQKGYRKGQNPNGLVGAIYSMLQHDVVLAYNGELLDVSLLQYRQHGVILQSVRRPKQTLYDSDANCIEGAVLYASLIEAAGLDAVILFSAHKDDNSNKFDDGHALVGWRMDKDAEDYEFLETTRMLDISFQSAINQGNKTYRELVKNGWIGREPFGSESFAYLLPVKEIRDKIYGIQKKVMRPSSAGAPTEQATEKEFIEPSELFSGSGNHFAVLVGASSYDAEDIYDQKQICPYDAEILYQQLLVNSFHPSRLHLLIDNSVEPLNNASILSCLRTLANASTARDLLLFYYSGAIKQDGQNYFLLTFDLLAERSDISLAQVREYMVQAAAQAKVVILDIYNTELNPQDPDDDQSIEEFMNTILEQLKDLTILASYKEKDQEIAASLFTHALVEEFQQLPGSGEILTVQNIYDNVSNNKITIYPPQPYQSKQTIICRPGEENRSYFLKSYQYLVHMQKTLMRVQEKLAQRMVTKDDIRKAITLLETVDDIVQPEALSPSIDENRLRDTLYTLHQRVEYLMEQELQALLGESQSIIAQHACKDVNHELLGILYDVTRKADELRAPIMPTKA